MKLYKTPITLELLKKHNKIFFDNATFHGDTSYEIVNENGRVLLKVDTELTGVVYYEVNRDDYTLNHTTL